jgi:hypothetical protein
MQDPLRLEFTYRYEDIAPTLSWRQRLSWIDLLGWLTLAAAAVVLFMIFGEAVDPAKKQSNWNGKEFLPYLLVFGVGYLFSRFKSGGRANWEKDNPPQVMTFLISPAGITLQQAAATFEFQWKAFKSIETTDRGIFLHPTPGYSSLYFPRRVMTEEQLEQFHRLATEALNTPNAFEVLPTKNEPI